MKWSLVMVFIVPSPMLLLTACVNHRLLPSDSSLTDVSCEYAYRAIANKNTVIDSADRDLNRSSIPGRAVEEMLDEIAQQLTVSIVSLPQVKNSSSLKALTVGRFKNETGIASGWVSYIGESVAERLLMNRSITNEFAIVAVDADRQLSILVQIAGPDFDRVFRSVNGSNFREVQLKSFHPQDVYVLSGSVFRLSDYTGDAPRMSIVLKMRLQHPRTGELLAACTASREYVYHSIRQSWLSKAENAGLRGSPPKTPGRMLESTPMRGCETSIRGEAE